MPIAMSKVLFVIMLRILRGHLATHARTKLGVPCGRRLVDVLTHRAPASRQVASCHVEQGGSWSATIYHITRSSPQWWSGPSTTDHTSCARSAFTHMGTWRKIYDCSLHHFTTSQCIVKCVSIDISVNLQPVGWNLTGGLFDSHFGVSSGKT